MFGFGWVILVVVVVMLVVIVVNVVVVVIKCCVFVNVGGVEVWVMVWVEVFVW